MKVKVLERLVDEEEDESGEAEGIVSILDPSPASPPALPPPALLPPAFAAVPSINSPKPTIVTIISTSVLLGVFPVLVLLKGRLWLIIVKLSLLLKYFSS